jgi:hypothetical protein
MEGMLLQSYQSRYQEELAKKIQPRMGSKGHDLSSKSNHSAQGAKVIYLTPGHAQAERIFPRDHRKSDDSEAEIEVSCLYSKFSSLVG